MNAITLAKKWRATKVNVKQFLTGCVLVVGIPFAVLWAFVGECFEI
jgi:hypothetical protein